MINLKHARLMMLIPALVLASCTGYPRASYRSVDEIVHYDDVYLIMGQSNATGVAFHHFLEESHPDVHARFLSGISNVLISQDVDERIVKEFQPVRLGMGHTDDFFGPEVGIADVLRQSSNTSFIIKATYSGSCLQTQYVDRFGFKHELYNRYISFIKEELENLKNDCKTPRIRGVFWMQGESDACINDYATYQEAEQYFYDYLTYELSPWIYGHFNFVDAYIDAEGIWPHYKEVNDAKSAFCSSNPDCYCIKTNGEDENAINLVLKSESGEGEDSAHYDSSSMLLLGQTAGQYLIK